MAENNNPTYLNNKLAVDGENILHARNMSYILDLQSDTRKYLNFLSTMSKYHRYPTIDLPSFSLEAPENFSAVAAEDIWDKLGYSVNDNAKGVTLYRNNEIVKGYDISEVSLVNPKNKPQVLWKYDESKHRQFLDAVIPGKADTVQKIIALSTHLANSANIQVENRPFVAYSIAFVVLERLGQSTNIPSKAIFQMDLSDPNINIGEITHIIHEESKKVLDAFKDIAQENFKTNANPLLAQLGVIDIENKSETNINQSQDSIRNTSVEENESNNEGESTPISEKYIQDKVKEIFGESKIDISKDIENILNEHLEQEKQLRKQVADAVAEAEQIISEQKNNETVPKSQNDVENTREDSAQNEKLYKYYLNARPVSPGAQPKDFISYNEGDLGGRYGAIYYNRELTEEEIKEYELTPSPFNQTNAYIIGNKEKERLANEEATSQNTDEISQDTVETSQNAALFRFKVRDEAVTRTNFQSQSHDDYIAEMDMSEETFKKFEHVTTSLVNEWGIQEVKAGKYKNGKGIFTFSTAQERDRFVSQAEDGLNNSKGAEYYSININGNKVNISNDDGKVSGAKSNIYKAKEVLKAYGGKWNKEEKAWYLENEEERNKLIRRFLGRFHFGEAPTDKITVESAQNANIPNKDRTLIDSDYEEETLPTSEIKDNNNEETQVINSSISANDFIVQKEQDSESVQEDGFLYFQLKDGRVARARIDNNNPERTKESIYKYAEEQGAISISKEEYQKGYNEYLIKMATERIKNLFEEDNIEKIFDILSVNDNTYSIKAFSDLSGISLDKTWKRRKQQLIDYYGEKYTKWQGEIQKAVDEKARQEEEEKEHGRFINFFIKK